MTANNLLRMLGNFYSFFGLLGIGITLCLIDALIYPDKQYTLYAYIGYPILFSCLAPFLIMMYCDDIYAQRSRS